MLRSPFRSLFILLFLCMLPVFLLIFAEAGLRLGGYGQDYSLFVPSSKGAEGESLINNYFYARNFSGDIRKAIEKAPAWGAPLSRKKEGGVFRVFLLGGSVALGDVPEPAFNIPRYLEVMLQATFPDTAFEIHNLACFALGSAVMRDAARQASNFSPDLFLVYMGNNEYAGSFLSKWNQGKHLHSTSAMQLLFRAQQSRLLQWAQSFYQEQEDPLVKNWNSFFQNAYSLFPDAPERELMYQNYEANLCAIGKYAKRAGAGMLLCSVPVNQGAIPPLGSVHHKDLKLEELQKWEHCFDTGLSLLPDDPDEALAAFQTALEIDEWPAKIQFHMGECLLALNRVDEAKERFQRACDWDAHPVRADSRINAIIRQSIEREIVPGILFADVEKHFSTLSPNGIVGQEYCYDFVHLTLEGNYQVASVIFDAMKDFIIAKTGAQQKRGKLSYEECCELLGLSPFLELQCLDAILEEQARFETLFPEYLPGPFKSLRNQLEASLTANATDEALEALENALILRGDDFYLRRLRCEILRDTGREREMREEATTMLERYGHWPIGAFHARRFLSDSE